MHAHIAAPILANEIHGRLRLLPNYKTQRKKFPFFILKRGKKRLNTERNLSIPATRPVKNNEEIPPKYENIKRAEPTEIYANKQMYYGGKEQIQGRKRWPTLSILNIWRP